MSTERPLFYLHSGAASKSICSETSLSISRKEIHDFFSDSLSALQVLRKLKTDHPLQIQIHDLLHKINTDQREIVFKCVPGPVGILGNEAADRAAKEALDKKPTADLMPFSDLKPLTARYVY